MIDPVGLLAALRAGAGGLVEEADLGSSADAPAVAGLPPARQTAILAAWTGARLHAGLPGLLTATNPDARLLIGDWCYAHALAALAAGEDVQAIALLAQAITAGAAGAGGVPATDPELAQIWAQTAAQMGSLA